MRPSHRNFKPVLPAGGFPGRISCRSSFGSDPRQDTPTLIPGIKKPTLAVVAGKGGGVVGLDKKVAPLADGERVRLKVVDGADRFFRDLYAGDAVDAIAAFRNAAGG